MLNVPRIVRCGKCQQLGHNKITCTNDEVPKPLSQKGRLEYLGKIGETNLSFTNSFQFAIPRRDGAPPILESGDQDGAPPISKSGDQDDDPDVTPMKRTKMMARRGGKIKVSRSRNKTAKKTPNGKQPISQAKEDVSLSCDEAFDDIFTHTPNVATMKEVYGEVEERDVQKKDVQEIEIKEREVEEREIEEREAGEGEVEEGEAEEGEVEEREDEEEEVEERERGWIKSGTLGSCFLQYPLVEKEDSL
ncbi:unnamed protein product [Lactuca virosa]|uniref:Uncharacterized protein n=1 Tax=Lactuca virosa TaxID=75947 RepID=A0AAU9N5B0_9ASTR|nr:unnamed protein product [Lactuca virosa]